jgi:hypothetical protein
MNTKILMQRLAKAASSKTKTSIAAIMIYSGGLALLTSTALFTSQALAFDGNPILKASLTEDMVTATEGDPNPGENYVHFVPSAPRGNYFGMSPLKAGRSVATHHGQERRTRSE